MPLRGIPEVRAGDDLAAIIARFPLRDGDIVVVAQKIVSKAEGRVVRLGTVDPGERARDLARATGKDPRLVQLVLDESSAVLRQKSSLLITRHRLGYIMADAGIDASNSGGVETVILLPADPDRSAGVLAEALHSHSGARVGVVITDSWGRPWRLGTTGVAIGMAGVTSLRDMRGHPDRDGRLLKTTQIATGDELAAAASLLMGQADEGLPVVVIRGLDLADTGQNAMSLIRPHEEDVFR